MTEWIVTAAGKRLQKLTPISTESKDSTRAICAVHKNKENKISSFKGKIKNKNSTYHSVRGPSHSQDSRCSGRMCNFRCHLISPVSREVCSLCHSQFFQFPGIHRPCGECCVLSNILSSRSFGDFSNFHLLFFFFSFSSIFTRKIRNSKVIAKFYFVSSIFSIFLEN